MKASVIINRNYTKGEIDKRIYGSFIEHVGRAVYGGIYEPSHITSDDKGFRRDVIELVRKLDVPVVRYPGGNFVSGYRWEDGTGDKALRPRRVELAWNSIETNQVGIDEFQEWAARAGSSVMMAVNLGTRGAEEARNCVEYCNGTTDTHYANMRRKNGFEKPFGIKVWCLGNEMDGPWQIGAKTPKEYARLATETAKLMKLTDPSIELVACGSSSPGMNTFIEWETEVLEQAYDYIDYISLHCYYGNSSCDTAGYLAKSTEMDRFIKNVAAVCDVVKAKKRKSKTVNISFDEWNVWFHSGGKDKNVEKWQIAPPLIEDIYNFEDALVIGCLLMTLQNNCNRVKMACLAQLINVIAPIMTENGGKAWVQTIYYPFMYCSEYGRGTVMDTVVDCGCYSGKTYANVPFVETSVIFNADANELVIFAVNRSLDEDMELNLVFEDLGQCEIIEHMELYNEDLMAVNDKENQRVKPVGKAVHPESGTSHNVCLSKHSWNMIRLRCGI